MLKNLPQKTQDPILAITQFLSSDLLQEEIQQLPHDLQEIFDLVLDSNYGDTLLTRQKMIRIKELITNYAKALAPFTEAQVQICCNDYQNKVSYESLV
jgi:hypothetical protein